VPLGYAVAFRTEFSGTHEHADIDVQATGYQPSAK